MRYNDTTRVKVKAAIALVAWRIAKKNTLGGSGGKLMRSGGRDVGVTEAAKNP